MANISVKLSTSYENPFDKTRFDAVVLREPNFRDIYVEGIGAPEELQPNGHGGFIVITNYAAIASYAERLVVSPDHAAILDLGQKDAKAIERAICGFFREQKDATESATS